MSCSPIVLLPFIIDNYYKLIIDYYSKFHYFHFYVFVKINGTELKTTELHPFKTSYSFYFIELEYNLTPTINIEL